MAKYKIRTADGKIVEFEAESPIFTVEVDEEPVCAVQHHDKTDMYYLGYYPDKETFHPLVGMVYYEPGTEITFDELLAASSLGSAFDETFDKTMAPWTEYEVAALNRYQFAGEGHPFTCALEHDEEVVLVATVHGWVCPVDWCAYTQTWAWKTMLQGMSLAEQMLEGDKQ